MMFFVSHVECTGGIPTTQDDTNAYFHVKMTLNKNGKHDSPRDSEEWKNRKGIVELY